MTSDSGKATRSAAVQLQLRRTAGSADDFDVTPQDRLRVPCAEGLHRCFLRREPAGEMNGRIVSAHAVRHFSLSEDAMREPFAVAFDRGSDTRDVGRVEAQSNDGHKPQA